MQNAERMPRVFFARAGEGRRARASEYEGVPQSAEEFDI